MYRENNNEPRMVENNGPRTVPCGTPDKTGAHSEISPFCSSSLCSMNHPIKCAPRTLERQESLLPLQQAFLMHIYHNASIYELTLKIRIENESVSRRIPKNNIVDLFVTPFLCVCLHILTVVTTIVSVR